MTSLQKTQFQLPSARRKWLPLFALSLPLAVGLFIVMQILISPKPVVIDRQDNLQSLEYVRVIHKEQVREKSRELPEKQKEPKTTPPSRPPLSPLKVETPKPTPIITPTLNLPLNLDQSIGLGGILIGGGERDGDVIPLVKIAPLYPRKALTRGIEGWVKVGINIAKTGAVLDVKVLEAEPRRIFNRSAIRSVFRWKFKPEIVDGKAVENYSTQVIHFKLDRKS